MVFKIGKSRLALAGRHNFNHHHYHDPCRKRHLEVRFFSKVGAKFEQHNFLIVFLYKTMKVDDIWPSNVVVPNSCVEISAKKKAVISGDPRKNIS